MARDTKEKTYKLLFWTKKTGWLHLKMPNEDIEYSQKLLLKNLGYSVKVLLNLMNLKWLGLPSSLLGVMTAENGGITDSNNSQFEYSIHHKIFSDFPRTDFYWLIIRRTIRIFCLLFMVRPFPKHASGWSALVEKDGSADWVVWGLGQKLGGLRWEGGW